MSEPTFGQYQRPEFPTLPEIAAYLEATDDASWCVDVVRTPEGGNCLLGHLEAMGGMDLYNAFEDCYANTYYAGSVNDGTHPDYQQASPRLRSVAFINDLHTGKAPTVNEIMMLEYEASMKRSAAKSSE